MASGMGKSFEFVLNLIINGLPSKRQNGRKKGQGDSQSFKPYYKWITF